VLNFDKYVGWLPKMHRMSSVRNVLNLCYMWIVWIF